MKISKTKGLIVVIVALYAAYPYYATNRLVTAMGNLDEKALETMVDWDSVRANLKEDLDNSAPRNKNSGSIGALGNMIVNSIAPKLIGSAVDALMTPSGIVTMTGADGSTREERITRIKLRMRYQFFQSPVSFRVEFAGKNDETKTRAAWILGFNGVTWKLVKLELPRGEEENK